ncbi:hypothetical protein R1sor_001458 [Riccia sorocarpa]|uniref:FAS1 domain-containing protein n=1 Tax=Riccia sorocarpa TaxID=122646 RepID=A0ABD3GXM8_9MARC
MDSKNLFCIVPPSAAYIPLLFTTAHNITAILEQYEDFTVLNQMLTSTGVADEINAFTGITILAPSNGAMIAFQKANPNITEEETADVMRYHALLRYVTVMDITNLEVGKFLEVSTLYSTTGRGKFDEGDVNIYNGFTKVLVGHAAQDNSTRSVVISTVYQQQLEINILMIDRTLEPVGFVPAVRGTANNITGILEGLGGYTTFTNLLMQTGADQAFNDLQKVNGITIFVPTDDAFDALPVGWVGNLDLEQQKLLLSYHALARYRSQTRLLLTNGSFVPTVATTIDPSGRSYLVSISGDQVTLTVTLVSSTPKALKATVMSTLYDGNPLIMFSINTILRPVELSKITRVGPVHAPTPSPVPTIAPGLPPTSLEGNSSKPEGTLQAVPPLPPPITSAGYVVSRYFHGPLLAALFSVVTISLGNALDLL